MEERRNFNKGKTSFEEKYNLLMAEKYTKDMILEANVFLLGGMGNTVVGMFGR